MIKKLIVAKLIRFIKYIILFGYLSKIYQHTMNFMQNPKSFVYCRRVIGESRCMKVVAITKRHQLSPRKVPQFFQNIGYFFKTKLKKGAILRGMADR